MPVPGIGGPSASQITANSDALYGAAGIASYPAAAAYANNVSVAEVVAYIQDGVRNGSGGALATNKSLVDVLGSDGTQRGAHPRMVTKTSASPLTTGTLFTWAGSIEIIRIIGRVSTAIQNQATTVKLSVVCDALVAVDICATKDVDNFAIGSLLQITGTAANAMNGTTAVGVTAPQIQVNPIVATCTTSGTLTVTYGAASTGAIVWECVYRPLNAAGVMAAA